MIALIINRLGSAFPGNLNVIGLIFAIALVAAIVYMLFFKKYQEATKLTVK